MKSRTLLSVGTVILTLLVGSAMAADDPANTGVASDPLSTERNPGPPALSPAETRAKQEQERKQSQIQQNGNQVIPIGSDNGAGKGFPGTLPGTTTNPNGNTDNPANQPGSTTSPNAPAGNVPASTAPSAPPATGNPGVQ